MSLRIYQKKYEDYNVYIKRDDQTGLASGVNKTRKLEYLIQEAMDSGCDMIITGGAQQSNHCRQTAAACSVARLECHLMLGGDEPEVPNGNLLLSNLLRAKIYFVTEDRMSKCVELLKEKLKADGKRPMVIPYRGSNTTRTMGNINAAKELQQQLKGQGLTIDYIFFASSSGAHWPDFTLGKELFGHLLSSYLDETDN